MSAHEVYAVKFGEHSAGVRAQHFHGSAGQPYDAPAPLDYFVWLVRTPGADIVFDTGFTAETAQRRGRTYLRTPAEALTALGVDCPRVPHVVLSHLHYDHGGGTAAFPGARFVVQAAELAFWTGRYAARREFRRLIESEDITDLVALNYAGRVEVVDGSHELVPGVSLHRVGGHTPGLQVVRVDTTVGSVVLAADASHLYENFEADAPFGVFCDLPAMYDTFDTLRRLASAPELVVPGHDPAVLDRFPAVAGLEGIAVRVA